MIFRINDVNFAFAQNVHIMHTVKFRLNFRAVLGDDLRSHFMWKNYKENRANP